MTSTLFVSSSHLNGGWEERRYWSAPFKLPPGTDRTVCIFRFVPPYLMKSFARSTSIIPKMPSAALPIPNAPISVHAIVPDLDFNKEDGDIILLVQNTRFKVHRIYFGAPPGEKTAFSDVLSQLGPDVTTPILVLQGTSVEELRGCLTLAYSGCFNGAGSPQLQDSHLEAIIHAINFAQRHRMLTAQRWLQIALLHVASRNNAQALNACSVQIYTVLLSSLVVHPQVQNLVLRAWGMHMLSGKLSPAHAINPSPAAEALPSYVPTTELCRAMAADGAAIADAAEALRHRSVAVEWRRSSDGVCRGAA
ncbi:hypothetical protein B0H11DRAFT_2295878 [Mycena galericulata]|nr:hypothetical protein B0H11DRAFT_2295878 [Mycena galericulata]